MVSPGVAGIIADRRFATEPILSILGFSLGFGYGIWRLIALAQATPTPSAQPNAIRSDAKRETPPPQQGERDDDG